MQQDLEGGESVARNPGRSQSITQLCSDPGKTRDRAEVGELNVPCHRCLAFDPAYRRSCLFLELPEEPTTLHDLEKDLGIDQQTLFHTRDTMETG